MRFDPRLAVPGTIFGSLLIVLLGLALTAGVTLPTPALAAVQPVVTPNPDGSAVIAVPDANTVDQPAPDAELDGQAASDPCGISDRFPQSIMQWCSLITHYANKRGLHPDLVASLILQESGGNPQAYSKSGAVGLMQVMPNDGLSSSFMCQAGPCFSNRPSTAELQDPEFNISYGTKLLADLQARYGDIREALKSYGPMNVGYYYADIVLGILQNYGN